MKTVSAEDIINKIKETRDDETLKDNPINMAKVVGMCDIALMIVGDESTRKELLKIESEAMLLMLICAFK